MSSQKTPASDELGARALGGLGQKVARTAAGAWLQHLSSLGVGVLLTPVLIQGLGAQGFGAWGVCLAIVGYVGLLEFGIGTAMAVDGARQLGANKATAFIGVFDAGRTFYATMAATVVACGVGTTWWLSRNYGDSPSAGDLTDVALILALAVGTNLISAPYSSLAAATGRADLVNVGRSVGTIAYGLCASATLMSGAGVRGVALSWALGQVVANAYIVSVTNKYLPVCPPFGSYSHPSSGPSSGRLAILG